MGIPKNAQNKDAAWTVLTYLTSKEWGSYEVARAPDRPDPELGLLRPGAEQEVPVPEDGGARRIEKAQILEIANIPETFELITIAAQQFAARSAGSSTAAAEACKKANDGWMEVLKRGGHLK